MIDFSSFLSDVKSNAKPIVAAMGKHVGWNDHIDDFGITTESLALVKQMLYLSAISENIDSGAWEKKNPGIFEKFNSLFIWRKGKNFIVGKIWASKDGKGRDKYPMIVCIECNNINISYLSSYFIPVLDIIEAKCKSYTTAQEVVAFLSNVNKELASKDFSLPNKKQVKYDFAESEILTIFESALRTSCEEDENSVSFRIEADNSTVLELSETFSLLFKNDPVLLVKRMDEKIVDVIVGAPNKRNIFALKANTKIIPTSVNTFSVSDKTSALRAQSLLKKSRDGILRSTDFHSGVKKINYKRLFEKLKIPLLITSCASLLIVGFAMLVWFVSSAMSSNDSQDEFESIETVVNINDISEISAKSIEDVWSTLCGNREWIASIKQKLLDVKYRSVLQSNKQITENLLKPFDYGLKKYREYDLVEVAEFGDNIDLSYAMQNPGNIIRKEKIAKNLREMLALEITMKKFCDSFDINKIVAETSSTLANLGFAKIATSLNVGTENNADFLLDVYQKQQKLNEIQKLFSVQKAEDDLINSITADAGFLRIANENKLNRALYSNVSEACLSINKNIEQLNIAKKFLDGFNDSAYDISYFKTSSDVLGSIEKTIAERISTLNAYKKNNEFGKIDLDFSAIDENIKTLKALSLNDDVLKIEMQKASIIQDCEKLKQIPAIEKHRGKLKTFSESILKKFDLLKNEVAEFTVARSDINAWINANKDKEITSNPIVNKVWKNYSQNFIKSLNLEELKGDVSKRISKINLFNLAYSNYNKIGSSIKNIDTNNVDVALRNYAELKQLKIIETELDDFYLAKANNINDNLEKLNSEIVELNKKINALKEAITSGDFAKKQTQYEALINKLTLINEAAPSQELSGILALNDCLVNLKNETSEQNIVKVFNRANIDINLAICAYTRLWAIFEKSINMQKLEVLKNTYEKIKNIEGINANIQTDLNALNVKIIEALYRKISDSDKLLRRENLGKFFSVVKNFNLQDSFTKEMVYEQILCDALITSKKIKTTDDFKVAVKDLSAKLNTVKVLKAEFSEILAEMNNLDISKASNPDVESIAKVGPAKKGWKLIKRSDELKDIAFEKDGVVLEFKLCSQIGEKGFYIQKTEFCVGDFFKIVKNNQFKSIVELLPEWKNDKFPDVLGPLVWSELKCRTLWIAEQNDAGNSLGEQPNVRSPMNWISFNLAHNLAKELGCRLPTKKEFLYLLTQDKNPYPNLRDKKWAELSNKYKLQNKNSISQRWADDGIFVGNINVPREQSAVESVATNDGIAWFACAKDSGEIENIIGNLWEYLEDESGKYVAGGSALSSKELPVRVAHKLSETDVSYSDVGMRLCFTAPNATLAQIFASFIITKFPEF